MTKLRGLLLLLLLSLNVWLVVQVFDLAPRQETLACEPCDPNWCRDGEHCGTCKCVRDVVPPDPPSGGCGGGARCGPQECCVGGECEADTGQCGGEATGCPAGASLQCLNPPVTVCTNVQSCGARFPSQITGGSGSCTSETHITCQVNCACCPTGSSLATGSTYQNVTWSTLDDDGWRPRFCQDTNSPPACPEGGEIQSCNVDMACRASGSSTSCPNYVTCIRYMCEPVCVTTAPTAPTLSLPGDGATLSSTNVTLMWNAATDWGNTCSSPRSNQYSIRVGTEADLLSNYQIFSTEEEVRDKTFTGVSGTTYYWAVWAGNGVHWSAKSPTWSFTLSGTTVTGTVYDDQNNSCSTANTWNTATQGPLTVTLMMGATPYTAQVQADGTYTVTAPPSAGNDLAVGIPAGYVCSTASACDQCSYTNVPVPTTGYNFFLTQSREAWWQAVGAGVYAGSGLGGVTIRSEMPGGQSLIASGAGGAIGALLRASGSNPDVGGGQISTLGYSTLARYTGRIINYDFFAPQMGVIPSQADDWGGNSITKPANNPSRDFYYIRPTGGTANVANPWNVANNESYVVFVNGNLRIEDNVTVANGGFVAFIVNGSITIDPSVTQVQGIYLADTTWNTPGSGADDAQLDVQGSIVAWGGVSLGRSLGGAANSAPAEKFTYRPDLLTNMPDKLKVFALRWQEVAPGTFGN